MPRRNREIKDLTLVSESTARRARDLLERTGVAGFCRWWFGELRAMAPTWVRDFLHPARAQLALAMQPDQQILYSWENGAWRELARWPRSGAAVQGPPPEATSALDGRERDVLVILCRADLLCRKAEIPAALAENLREAIGFDLDRYTPYKPDQVYFDSVVCERDELRQRLTIDIGVVPRDRADRILDQVQGMGLRPVGLLPELPGEATAALDFLPTARRPRGNSAGSWAYGLPLVAIGLLALATILFPIWQKRATVRALEPLVKEAQVRAEAAESLHRQLIAQQDEHNFLLAKKRAQPMAIDVLDEATRILPDDTWVHMLELKSDPKNPGKNFDLQVRGETGISGKLIAVFEESRLFAQTAYKSPVTKGQPGAGDLFHVGAEVKKRPVPELGVAAASASATQSALVPASQSNKPPAVEASAPAPVPANVPGPAAAGTPMSAAPPPGAIIPPPPRTAP